MNHLGTTDSGGFELERQAPVRAWTPAPHDYVTRASTPGTVSTAAQTCYVGTAALGHPAEQRSASYFSDQSIGGDCDRLPNFSPTTCKLLPNSTVADNVLPPRKGG